MSEAEDTMEIHEQRPKYLTAEYKNGQLQIIEVTPFDRERTTESDILPDLNCDSDGIPEAKYMQVLNVNKGLVQLDLNNLTLIRTQDGEESYQLVANGEAAEGETLEDSTVTCVLQSSDNEDHDSQESYVMMNTDSGQGPLVFLQSTLQQVHTQKMEDPNVKKLPTPAEILEKAKALQKAKALMCTPSPRKRGRKRKGDLPPPHELLNSPNFKLYLYSCKLCNFKCNAVKEMSAHKASDHGSGGRARGGGGGGTGVGVGGAGRGAAATLQCARCPYRAITHSQFMKHVQDIHLKETVEAVHLNTEEVEAADVLVCGACGFESSSKAVFRIHIEDEHGATTC